MTTPIEELSSSGTTLESTLINIQIDPYLLSGNTKDIDLNELYNDDEDPWNNRYD